MSTTVIHGEGLGKEYRRGRLNHYPVLDALRFVLALWVAIGHGGIFPLFAGADTTSGFMRLLTRGWNTIVFGTPAVIVFFVISGFCIHLPFIGTETISIGRYYLRRYTRILIPVVGALCVYRLYGQHLILWGEHSVLWESPLWSLACEEIYYAAYPLLRWLRNRFGWRKFLPAAFLAGVATAATHPHSLGWHDFGPFGTALLLLPVWLLGCLLAEQSSAIEPRRSTLRIWSWRFLIWLGCWTSEMLHFKMGVPYTQTMIWFGVLAYYWVREEIAYGKHRDPNRFLAMAGAWSYSLYLVHVQGMETYALLRLPNPGYILAWTSVMLFGLGFAYLFYLLVERPSHQLARKIQVFAKDRSAIREKPAVALPSAHAGSDFSSPEVPRP
jgi:peptidoglycan/LPS O-acetylase OafA/YrhL